MERLGNGKVKVQGVHISRARSTRFDPAQAIHEAGIDQFFDNVHIRSTDQPFEARTLYIGTGLSTPPPWVRIRSRLNFNEPNLWREGSRIVSTRYVYRPIRESDRSRIESGLIIKFNGRPAIMGYYWTVSRSLYIAGVDRNADTVQMLRNVVDYLREHSSLGICRTFEPEAPVEIPRLHFTVGADPEFEVVNQNGQVVSPRSGRDANLYSSGATRGEIGVDGAGSQVEVRPSPAEDPEDVVENIKGIIGRIRDRLSTIGHTYAVGGHIHIGVGQRIAPPRDLLFLLDTFLGKPTLNLSGRARAGYRNLSAYECKNWGFEYRTPPAAIFTFPKLAKIAMKICKYITEAFFNGDEITITAEPEPTFMDYFKYARLSKKEWDTWRELINRFRGMSTANDGYQHNVVAFWTDGNTSLPAAQAAEQQDESNRDFRLPSERDAGLNADLDGAGIMPRRPRSILDLAEDQPAHDNDDLVQAAEEEPVAHRQRPDSSQALTFSDDWREESIAVFRQEVGPEAERIYRATGLQIILYGLATHRGINITAGFPFQDYGRIDPAPRPDPNWYGIPFHCRMSRLQVTNGTVRLMALALAEYLRITIRT